MTTPSLDRFESALLNELRDHVSTRATSVKATGRTRRFAPIAAAAAATGLATVGFLGFRAEPAFAVERQSSGDVVVSIVELSDSKGLERALADHGVTAYVTYDADASKPTDLDTLGLASCAPVGTVVVDHAEDGGVTFTLDAEYVGSPNVLDLTVAQGGGSDDWIAAQAVWTNATC